MIRTREPLEVDRATLPTDGTFQRIGVERRQVFDIQISSVVTEYQAEILEDEHGRRVVAPFPEHVTVKAQYASGVKIHSVYMSNFQLLPYKRIEEHFADQFSIPLSTGSIDNFNKEAYEKLAPFEDWVKQQLAKAPLLHADETGIDIGGHRKWLHVACSTRTDRMNQNIYRGHRKWLHVACSPTLTLLMPHEKRGGEAIAAMGVLPEYTSFPSTLAPEYMIIGNPTTSCAVATPCATLTTCASCSGLGSRTNSSGLNTCKRCCWRSTRSLKPQAVCSTPRKPTPSERAIDNSSKRPRSRVPQRTSHNGKKASAVD
jgi:transposase